VDANGVNFSLFSEHATSIELLLFGEHDDAQPEHVIELDRIENRSFHFWHCHVEGLRAGQVYAYRAAGPENTSTSGQRFNPNKVS